MLELSEWVLSRLLLRHLRDRLEPRRPPKARYRAISAFTDEAIVLLSALAYAGADEDAAAERAFKIAEEEAGLRGAQACARDACPPRALESALETFALLIPEEKRRLVSACAASVAADGLGPVNTKGPFDWGYAESQYRRIEACFPRAPM